MVSSLTVCFELRAYSFVLAPPLVLLTWFKLLNFSLFIMDTKVKQCCTSASLTDSGGIDRVHIEHAILCYTMNMMVHL